MSTVLEPEFSVARAQDDRLRVATFTSLFPSAQQPLHGTFVWERIKALARLCDVRVIAPVPWAPPVRWLGERYYRYSQIAREELQDGTRVRHPRFLVIPKVLKALDGLLMGACCFASLSQERRTFQFDVIDAHWAYPDGFAAALLSRTLKIPLAITVRGDDINIFAKQFWRGRSIRWALRQASVVIALSDDLGQELQALGVPRSKIALIPNGVDTQRFYPIDRRVARERLGLPASGRILLSVGRLHTSKGFHIVVEALGKLHTEFPDLKLAIIGGPDAEADSRPAIHAAAARYGISDKVLMIGPQPQKSLVDWYNAADLFCLPTAREGSANVLLEAMACGLPCLTTAVGGNPEIVSTPKVGVLIRPEAEAFRKAIAASLEKQWDRDAILAHIRTRTWSTVAERCHSHLRTLKRN